MKIIVSHPGRQHAYKLIESLVDLGHEVIFCTGIAFQKKKWFIPKRLTSKRLLNQSIKLKTFPLIELAYQIAKHIINPLKARYYYERIFDKQVSKWIKNKSYDLFIGYEVSALRSFEEAKKKQKIVILDLAQIHFKELEKLSQAYSCLSYLSTGKLRTKINLIKEAEIEKTDYIFSISDFVSASLIKAQINPDKILKLPIWHQSKTTPSNAKNEEAFTIIYVGSIRDQKGIELLINATDNLINQKIRLILIGAINEAKYHQIIARRDYIHHISYVPHNELNKWYGSADVFVLPSYLDSWGMVVIEAMSNGIPLIVSENVGAKEAVNAENGTIITTGDQLALQKAIKFYIENPQILKNHSSKASLTSHKFSKENSNLLLKRHLEKIISQSCQE